MSATLPNLDLLAAWLNADLYRTDYRPVPLTECFKMGTALYDSSLNLLRDIDTTYTVKVCNTRDISVFFIRPGILIAY